MRLIITLAIDSTKVPAAKLGEFRALANPENIHKDGTTDGAFDRALHTLLGYADSAIDIDVKRVPQWTAGWNVPGYLPDSDPQTFDTWVEAHDALYNAVRNEYHDQIERAEGDAELVDELRRSYESACTQLDHAKGDNEYWLRAFGKAWWVTIDRHSQERKGPHL